jgi:phytoene dehydrogenase-like protein
MTDTVDAVVIGAGHNGLVAAALLADRGWDVLVVEGADQPGGAVRSDELVPGWTTDLFSSFYPMAAASPVLRGLHLEEHGLQWSHAPTVLAHLRPDAPAALLFRDPQRTAQELDRARPGDGAAWLELSAMWDQLGRSALEALLSPFPPLRAGARLVGTGRTQLWDLARLAIQPVRRLAAERFAGVDPALLLAGNALHADVGLDAAPSAFLGWLLVGLGQTVGFPVPSGGASQLTAALVSRMRQSGAVVRLECPARSIEVRGGRAIGVVTDHGTVRARRAVLAACDAEVLYGRLLDDRDLPPAFMARMAQFERSHGTVKLDYALSGPVPWRDERARDAGTVHIADDLAELTTTTAQLANRMLPSSPFLLVGQMTTSDASRSPAGTESFWAYTHVPQEAHGDAGGEIEVHGRLRGEGLERFAHRMEERIERHAPGFRELVVRRRVVGPDDMEAQNPSLVGGDISGGTAQLHQQLVFRPVAGLGRAETPVEALYLASSSAHPGGSVHGAAGANAARAAMARVRLRHWGAVGAVGALVAAPAITWSARR